MADRTLNQQVLGLCYCKYLTYALPVWQAWYTKQVANDRMLRIGICQSSLETVMLDEGFSVGELIEIWNQTKAKVLRERRQQVGEIAHVAASKAIEWEGV